MFTTFLSHGFKQVRRSPIWAKSVATNVVLGFFALLLLSYVLILGAFLHVIADGLVQDYFPEATTTEVIARYVLYYFGFEFIIRFFLQNTPVLFIQPYLHLPLRRSTIIHFMLRKSMVSVFNLIALLLLLPFGFISILPAEGFSAFLGWTLSIFGLSMLNHFLGIYVKKKMNDYPNLIFVITGILVLITAVEYFGLLEFSAVSNWLFGQFMGSTLLAVIPLALAMIFYQLNFVYLKNNTYPEEIAKSKQKRSKISGDFAFLRRFGKIGQLVAVELKLILRHKRPRNTLVISCFLLLYGLIFYPQEEYQSMSWIFIFVGVFITGLFFINHGQFMLSWQSGHFDFVLTRNINLRQYLESKYWLFAAASSIAFIISIAYVYFGWKIVAINLAGFLFNLGINIPVVMRLSMLSPKKIDLNRGAAFNYEGMGAAQWLMMLPVLVGPYVFYLPFSLAGYESYGIIAVGLVGVIGFLFHRQVLDKLTKVFTKNRHKIAAGFRAQ